MDAAKIIDILALGRAFVEAGWYQGGLAANDFGSIRDLTCPSAVQFCAIGAFRRARFELGQLFDVESDPLDSALWNLLATASGHPGDNGIELPRWNDDPRTTQADILRAYDRAAQEVGKG